VRTHSLPARGRLFFQPQQGGCANEWLLATFTGLAAVGGDPYGVVPVGGVARDGLLSIWDVSYHRGSCGCAVIGGLPALWVEAMTYPGFLSPNQESTP